MVRVDKADRDQCATHADSHQRLPAEAEAPRTGGSEQGREYLYDRIAHRDRLLAIGALRAEQQVAQHRYVLPRLDRCAAGRAPRARHDEVEAALRDARRRFRKQLLALFPPVALHHQRQAEYDDVEKTPDHQREREYDCDEDRRRLYEQFSHSDTHRAGPGP